jgi:alpha-galactosidase
MSLWCLLAAPLLAGNDLRNMSDATLSMLTNTEVIAVNQDPAGRPVKRMIQSGNTEVWTRPLEDGSVAVGLFNRDAQDKPVSVTLSALGLTGQLKARDLWKHQDVSVSGDTYTETVPKHGVIMLRIAKS